MKNNSPFILTLHIIFILLIQLLILNNVLIFNRIHPYLYPLIILFLPLGINKTFILFIGFFSGFLIDIFNLSYGIHAASSTLIAFLRPYLLRAIVEEREENKNLLPGLRMLGLQPYFIYLIAMIFLHHLVLYLIDAGSLRDFFYTLFKTFFSTIVSVLVIFIYEIALLYKQSSST